MPRYLPINGYLPLFAGAPAAGTYSGLAPYLPEVFVPCTGIRWRFTTSGSGSLAGFHTPEMLGLTWADVGNSNFTRATINLGGGDTVSGMYANGTDTGLWKNQALASGGPEIIAPGCLHQRFQLFVYYKTGAPQTLQWTTTLSGGHYTVKVTSDNLGANTALVRLDINGSVTTHQLTNLADHAQFKIDVGQYASGDNMQWTVSVPTDYGNSGALVDGNPHSNTGTYTGGSPAHLSIRAEITTDMANLISGVTPGLAVGLSLYDIYDGDAPGP